MNDKFQDTREFKIAEIKNRHREDEIVHILYVPSFNAFITEGIHDIFGLKEILIPAYMVVKDLELIGSIISIILEDMSVAREQNDSFKFTKKFELMGKCYVMEEKELYVELLEEKEDPFNL
jgi:hypothetical protein